MKYVMIIALYLSSIAAVQASEVEPLVSNSTGEVRVPLSSYQQMLQQLNKPPQSAPAAYAMGQSNVSVVLNNNDDRFAATVNVTVHIEIFENEWTLVPILPTGTALRQASVDGQPAQLVQGVDGLAWSSNKAGRVTLQLAYGLDAMRSDAGYQLALPVPTAAATVLNLSYPGTGVDLSVVPAVDLKQVEDEQQTRFNASIPATSSIFITWRAASTRPFAISRASYSGVMQNKALVWKAMLQVEAFESGPITLPLMASTVTLNNIRVDDKPATVLEDAGHFTTVLQGRGVHNVEVEFQVPVILGSGPPQARLQIPRIPVSRFNLSLPGKKDVKVTPAANVVTQEEDEFTRASAYIPMSDTVTFSWTDAVPLDLRTTVRANASLYHAVHAEEGVLHARASVVYEITHGETSRLELSIPESAQVNSIVAPGIVDWTVADADARGRKKISVFLEQAVSGQLILDVFYEQLLGANANTDESISVPLLSADNVHRQRGMVALLSGKELALRPLTTEGAAPVGENQLPPFVRNAISMTVAHTYKYSDPAPTLEVEAVTPERKQGVFDAQIDTLVSLGDVTMKGSATIGIDVKSGSLVDLTLRLPQNVNVLGVSGPSLRTHNVSDQRGGQTIDLEFTREMEGQFRVEVNYERIMASDSAESDVPTISVSRAEVEHGRIAVQALTAVEVQAASADQLSNLDVNELPRQLLLKTTNPILLAYRYVNANPPAKLSLRITRHQEIDVQVAAIEQANYSSLFTRDGLAVTTARLMVRNSRRQFLRLALPPESEIWSVFVNGKPEKPAFASDESGNSNNAILIKMINSTEGFPVDVVYATSVQEFGSTGSIGSRLPRPDMVVTHTQWDVFMPTGFRYRSPASSMNLVKEGIVVDPRRAQAEVLARSSDAYQTQMGEPLRINVPTRGIQYSFEKLYANQSDEDAGFSLRYTSGTANQTGVALSALGVILLWIGILAVAGWHLVFPKKATVSLLAAGGGLLAVSFAWLGTNPVLAASLALLIALALGTVWIAGRLRDWRAGRLIAAA